MTIADGPPTVPQVKAGKVKALAVTGAERSSELPDTPSMAEAGFPAVDIHLWSGIFRADRNAGPDRRQAREGAGRGDRDPGVAAKLKAMAVNPGGATPENSGGSSTATSSNTADVIKAANLHFEE